MSLYWEGSSAPPRSSVSSSAALGGWLADKLGRKPLFAIDLAIFILGSVLQFFVDSAWQLFVVRLLMGIAIGADYSVGWPLLSEFAPRRLRGKLLAYCEVAWYVGFMFAFVIGYVMTTVWSLDWRIVLGSSTVPAVILFLARLGMPESPRWLMNKGRTEEATEIAHAYLEDPSDVVDIANEGTRSGTFGMLFSPPTGGRRSSSRSSGSVRWHRISRSPRSQPACWRATGSVTDSSAPSESTASPWSVSWSRSCSSNASAAGS